ncbi:hypothetical protein [Aliikangiella coralliicola]|uniref:Uncharacterized protein n=1 Tax=Aliikangiella coralliicola TaxID=2592383 RepID=A0A545U0B4_9GAMM|nr:hypothetical protein [Aliikangiella coralliicola]TQV82907.1 hypothetical protein FLL46_24360 [Aliikangiella coralliicola]
MIGENSVVLKKKLENRKSAASDKHHPVRRLLVFQLKLAIDALRDILLSPVSIIATVLDLIEGRSGKKSYFETLLKFGRMSEKRINLFDQYDGEGRTVDSVLAQVEDVLVKEYKNGDISAKAKSAIETSLKIKNKTRHPDNDKNRDSEKDQDKKAGK